MAATLRELEGLNVKVDDVIYMPSLDAPEDKPHPFVYFISIRNTTSETVTIRAMGWIAARAGEHAEMHADDLADEIGGVA